MNRPGPAAEAGEDARAIRGLVDAYAHHADRREPEAQAAVFRYLDTFDRGASGWLISRRDLVFDWADERPSRPAA